MTPEEYKAKLVAVRDHYKPQIEVEFATQRQAMERAAELAAAQQKLEQELLAYFSAFRAKHNAETIIQMGEPSLPGAE
jgi:hypothetical protein